MCNRARASYSRRASELTDMRMDERLFRISTSGMQAKVGGGAGRTVGRTARAAAIGGLIGGSSGAKTGAKVGVGASIVTRGASVNIPRGTIVETSLNAPLEVPR